MSIAIIIAAAMAYAGIGTWAITRGPLAEGLHRFRLDMSFGLTLRQWTPGREEESGKIQAEAVPPWRARALWLTVHAGTLLGWPVFLPGAWRAERAERRRCGQWLATRPMQRLARQTEGGRIECGACGYSQWLPYSPPIQIERGKDRYHWAHPYQCLECRALTSIANDLDPDEQRCTCGGLLGRDHITRRSQESSATRDLKARISLSKAAAGVAQPNVWRGRPFISLAT